MPVLFYVYFVLAVMVAMMAKIRGRLAWRWFLIALFITPLAAGILVVALPRLPPAPLLRSAQEIVGLSEATLRVIRRSSALDALRPYVIYVNGGEVGSVAQDGVVDFQVPSGPLSIEAYCDWAGSPPLTVEVAPRHRIEIEVANARGPIRALWAIAFRPNGYLTLRQLPAADASRVAA